VALVVALVVAFVVEGEPKPAFGISVMIIG
jgi:hypothetical protein